MLPAASGGHGNIMRIKKKRGKIRRKRGSTCVCPGSVYAHVVAQVYARCLCTCLRTCPHACRCRCPRAPRTCPYTCRSRSTKVSAPSAFAAGALAEKKTKFALQTLLEPALRAAAESVFFPSLQSMPTANADWACADPETKNSGK